ncbi:MAG: peptidoglycan-associated lipoprotein Pal [Deltaproteobacteria bacterium]|nr:MAG: peptidoglycan-associated lipoprotein Pal [Deltaproteobacteria bacterium]
MIRKSVVALALILCLGLVLTGCPKKTVMKDEPTVKKSEDAAARAAAERAEREKAEKEREAAREREREAARVREREEAAKREQEKAKEFEKSLVAKKQPGIEGEVLESKLLKDIHFDFDKYDVRPQDAQIMKENAALLTKHPTVKIQVEGHCDERGTAEYNLALGERRANSAKKYLVSLGIPENRLSAISYGEENPLDPAHNEEAWAKNRRAHFVILPK